MRREDPPESSRKRHAWQEEADGLRADPGKWYMIADDFPTHDKWDRAAGLAGDINSGRLMAFRPKGSFEAKSHSRQVVHARYIGEHREYAEG